VKYRNMSQADTDSLAAPGEKWVGYETGTGVAYHWTRRRRRRRRKLFSF
jgi:selenocysteine lyase/cysteine desulfurase